MAVTRRTVLKTIAATLLAPTIALRREIDREALVSAFCGESFRYSIDKPFLHGGLTYATDARGIIRAELAAPLLDGANRKLPNVAKCWEDCWRPSTKFVPFELPPVGGLLTNKYGGTCPVCCGRRVPINVDLDSGWCASREASERGFDIDDMTVLDESCEHCNGKEFFGPSLAKIGNTFHSYHLIKRIAALPSVQVAEAKDVAGYDLICFRADGFEGMQMGVVYI